MLAAPSAAQTTVTSNGREGPTACLVGQKEINATDLSITALSTAQVTFTAPQITWNQYVTRLGDVPAPSSATVLFVVKNARADTEVGRKPNALIRGVTLPSDTQTISNLVAKTSYYLEVTVTSAGIPAQVFARRCFMTGGTYTMNAAPGTGAQGHENNFNSGCFSISPLTQQHVRNCWCGRKTTLPLFSSTQDNTALLNRWGCR